jgi:hypothetical protein
MPEVEAKVTRFLSIVYPKYIEIGGCPQSADQQNKEGWSCHGLLRIPLNCEGARDYFVNTQYRR